MAGRRCILRLKFGRTPEARLRLCRTAALVQQLAQRQEGIGPERVQRQGSPETGLGLRIAALVTQALAQVALRLGAVRKIGGRHGRQGFSGTGLLEDVDFSFNVRGAWRLAVASGARLAHYSHPIRPEREFLLGKWQVINRMHLVRKYRDRGLSVPLAWWAGTWLFILHLAAAVMKLDAHFWNRARGNFAGIVAELGGRRERVGGHLK